MLAVLKFSEIFHHKRELSLKVLTTELVILLTLLIGKQRSQTIQVLR